MHVQCVHVQAKNLKIPKLIYHHKFNNSDYILGRKTTPSYITKCLCLSGN